MTILLTGAAGFIGSYVLGALNALGMEDIIIVDDFSRPVKRKNLENKTYSSKIERSKLPLFLLKKRKKILKPDFVIHLGARTDTTEFDENIFNELNVKYSQLIWEFCVREQIPLIYASSAATYGIGDKGYSDDEKLIRELKPLNPYGWSKQRFDCWVLGQNVIPPRWYGLKFFNVYGPNDYHKGRMASVVFHGYRQIKEKGFMRLFRSHRSDIADGFQKRDFIYVKDVAEVIIYLMKFPVASGIYNVGSGQARTFLDLANAVFAACKLTPRIEWLDTPLDIRNTYQYYTCADMSKFRRNAAYTKPFTSLEEGVHDYVTNYLIPGKYF